MKVKENIERVRQMRKMALAKLIIPFCIAGAAVLFFWFFVTPTVCAKYAAVVTTYFITPLFGTEVAISVGLSPVLGIRIPPEALIPFLIFIDSLISLFLVWNFDYTKKIPYIGKLVERAEQSGERAIKKYKWAKRRRFIGLVIFVMIPLQYTGSAVGSIAGRLMGMAPLMTWLAVVVGSFLRSTIVTIALIVFKQFIHEILLPFLQI